MCPITTREEYYRAYHYDAPSCPMCPTCDGFCTQSMIDSDGPKRFYYRCLSCGRTSEPAISWGLSYHDWEQDNRDPSMVIVQDIETTGLRGLLYGDKIVEFQAVVVHLKTGDIEPICDSIIHHDLTDQEKDSWIFHNSTLTPDMVEESKTSLGDVIRKIGTFDDWRWTSYNVDFDYQRFLNQVWGFNFRVPFDIMDLQVMQTAQRTNISQETAYNVLCPHNPAGLDERDGSKTWWGREGHKQYREKHRALSDQVQEQYILLECVKNPEIKEIVRRGLLNDPEGR